MTDIEVAAPSPAERPDDATPAEINVADFSRLVASMSKLLTGLGRIPPFADGGLSLAEWTSLTILTQKDGISNKWIARNLGVTGQRANQIVTSLARGGFVSIGQSSRDQRVNDIRITEAGKAKMDVVNSELKSLLFRSLKGRGGSLEAATKRLKFVSRVLQAGKPDAPDAPDSSVKKDRKAKKKAKVSKSQLAEKAT